MNTVTLSHPPSASSYALASQPAPINQICKKQFKILAQWAIERQIITALQRDTISRRGYRKEG